MLFREVEAGCVRHGIFTSGRICLLTAFNVHSRHVLLFKHDNLSGFCFQFFFKRDNQTNPPPLQIFLPGLRSRLQNYQHTKTTYMTQLKHVNKSPFILICLCALGKVNEANTRQQRNRIKGEERAKQQGRAGNMGN